jgi:hypothetical protein
LARVAASIWAKAVSAELRRRIDPSRAGDRGRVTFTANILAQTG